jgi:hypothetical protein
MIRTFASIVIWALEPVILLLSFVTVHQRADLATITAPITYDNYSVRAAFKWTHLMRTVPYTPYDLAIWPNGVLGNNNQTDGYDGVERSIMDQADQMTVLDVTDQ